MRGVRHKVEQLGLETAAAQLPSALGSHGQGCLKENQLAVALLSKFEFMLRETEAHLPAGLFMLCTTSHVRLALRFGAQCQRFHLNA